MQANANLDNDVSPWLVPEGRVLELMQPAEHVPEGYERIEFLNRVLQLLYMVSNGEQGFRRAWFAAKQMLPEAFYNFKNGFMSHLEYRLKAGEVIRDIKSGKYDEIVE